MKRLVLTLLLFVFLYESEAQICQTLTVNTTSVLCHGNSTGSATVLTTGGTAPFTYTWSPSAGNASVATGLSAGVYTLTVADAGTCVVTRTVNIAQPNFFLAVSSQTNLVCYDGVNFGAATFTTIGGTNPKTYTWFPTGGNSLTATGLGPGTYTFLTLDANLCSYTQTVTITGPSFALNATLTQTNNTCGNTGGGATASVTGGTAPYNYTWSPSGGNAATATLVAGIYTLNVSDANNCAFSTTVNIIQSLPYTLTSTVSNVKCFGANNGSVSVVAAGGVTPYTYTWSPSGGNGSTATNLAPGTYTLSTLDAVGCTNSATYTITEPPLLMATSTQTNILCNGGTGAANVTATGGSGAYTYSWLPSGGSASLATGLLAGEYTVTVRDANLCSVIQIYDILQPTPLLTTGSQTNILCNGASTGAASVSVTGGTGAYTYTWSPSGGNAASASALSAGVYTLTARDNNSCTVTRNYTITQSSPIISSAAITSITCNGLNNGSATLTVSGGLGPYTYTWVPSGGNLSSASSLAGGNYSVQIRDANNCLVTSTLFIAEPAPLTSTVVANNISCFGLNNGSASLTISGGVAPYSYSWTPGSISSPSLSSLSSGNYSVTLRDVNLCFNTHTFTIVNPPQYTVSANVTNILCGGQNTGSGTVSVSGATPLYSYSWAPSGGTAAIGSSLTAGNYTVTVLDANNCVFSQTLNITAPPVLTGTITTTAANCNNPDGSATASVTGGTGTYSYAWAPLGGNTATATALAAGDYTCIVIDQNNCTLNLVSTVAAINPSVNLTALSSSICPSSSTTIDANGSISYTWSPSSSLSSSTGSLVTASPGVTTIYTVTGVSLYSCTVSNTIQITVLPFPVPTVSVNAANLCAGTQATLQASGAVNYTWSPSAGLSSSIVSNPTYTLGSPVIFTITASDAIGCSGTNTFAVNPLPSPTVVISSTSPSVCINSSATLSASGASTYVWSEGSAITSTLQISPTVSSPYVVTGTGANGCTNSATLTVGVNPLPVVTINATTLVCQGVVSTLTASGAATYSWNTGDAGATLSVSPTANTSYTVIGTDANGCVNTSEIDLELILTPSVTISGRQEVCRNETLTLNASGAANYTWSTGQQTSTVMFALTASTVITVSSAIGNCPPGTASLSVLVNPLPILNVSATSTVIDQGQSVQLGASSSQTVYTWIPTTGLSCGNCANPVAQPSETTVYTVSVSSAKGCVSARTITVEVDNSCNEVFTPTAFSPDGDGNNDTWCIYGNCISEINCEIFNRWGQKVATLNAINQCWDGNINGVAQNTGVFIFQAKVVLKNGNTQSLKGNFTLIR